MSRCGRQLPGTRPPNLTLTTSLKRLAILALAVIWGAAIGGFSLRGAAPNGSAAVEASAAPVFGLTNLWQIDLTILEQDWKTLGSRGGPQERRGMGMVMPKLAMPDVPGFLEGIYRAIFGGPATPKPAAGETEPVEKAKPAPESPAGYPWVTGTLEAFGERRTNVALRFKGVSSMVRSPNPYKRPFKIDFDRGAKGRTFGGVEELYLNNNVNDATQLREALSYELFRRAGLPAPRTAFAQVRLTIPGRFERRSLGLYTVVEAVEGGFLKRALGSRNGLLLKPEMMHGLEYRGDQWAAYEGRYRVRNRGGTVDPNLTARFIEFVRFVHRSPAESFEAQLSEYLDPQPFLRFVALNAILANVDSFIGNGHNYYLYVTPDTRRSVFIPWDLNESFGVHPASGPSGEQMEFRVLEPNADPNRLVERATSSPGLAARYREECEFILARVFTPESLFADIDRISKVVLPVVQEESRRAREDFERTVLKTRRPEEGDTDQPRHDREYAKEPYEPWSFPGGIEIDNLPLKDWIAGRHAFVRDELDGKAKGRRARPRLQH